jgi:hypothetical protein
MKKNDSYHGDLEHVVKCPRTFIYEIIEAFGRAAAFVKRT